MNQFSREILGKNIRTFREAAGLTISKFANLNRISKTTLRNIEAGENSSSFDIIAKILNFLGIPMEKALDKILDVPPNFRMVLQNKYRHNDEYRTLLNEKPSIPYALEYKLLTSEILTNPITIKEIKQYFDTIGWEWDTHLISDAIRDNKERLGISTRRKAKDKRAFEYFVVQKS